MLQVCYEYVAEQGQGLYELVISLSLSLSLSPLILHDLMYLMAFLPFFARYVLCIHHLALCFCLHLFSMLQAPESLIA
jgi:cellulose synthase/poly-beta-1,6-N-acetylglucosamine synthase-like glycosyltransferase